MLASVSPPLKRTRAVRSELMRPPSSAASGVARFASDVRILEKCRVAAGRPLPKLT